VLVISAFMEIKTYHRNSSKIDTKNNITFYYPFIYWLIGYK